MTAPNPLREDEVLAVKAALVCLAKQSATVTVPSKLLYLMARAAILRLDQVREGRGK